MMIDAVKTVYLFIRYGLPVVWSLSRCENIHGQRFGLRFAWQIQWSLCRDWATGTGYWEADDA